MSSYHLKNKQKVYPVKLAVNKFKRFILVSFLLFFTLNNLAIAATAVDTVKACVIAREIPLDSDLRSKLAFCLGWQEDQRVPLCHGFYHLDVGPIIEDKQEVQISADKVSLYKEGRSELKGNIEIRETNRIISADTAYITRDPKTHQIIKIELLNGASLIEPDKLIIAKRVSFNPEDKSGQIEEALFRFSTKWAHSISPAWGRAYSLERFSNEDYLLKKATYTTCPPGNCAWLLEADSIYLNHYKKTGTARNVTLKFYDWPILYAPYLSFPTSKERKSGFLMPLYGYTNIGGLDLGFPYYWNMAPNYDSILVPHVYSRRGLMLGGNFRFLTHNSSGYISANVLPNDRAFGNFLAENQLDYPRLRKFSDNRWYILARNETAITNNLIFRVNYQQVSDDYYLQDFSTNLAINTQSQLLRQFDLTYTIPHWYIKGMLQSYQTLHPINQSSVDNIYERLPQIVARGTYEDLPFGTNLNLQAQLDKFRWAPGPYRPQGVRYHVNPVFYLSLRQPWYYLTPMIQVVNNYYDLNYQADFQTFNFNIPRYSLDSGLVFERQFSLFNFPFTQTLEPRLYYLKVPYHNQMNVPNFDSAYMIFTIDQLFRNNRFSGFDRIGDTNQLTYAFTTRFLNDFTGKEFASFTIGQIRYFADRKVQLCYNPDGICQDNEYKLGFLPPDSKYSPIASRVEWQFNPQLIFSGGYMWDVYNHQTNNANLNIYYKPLTNHIINLNYNYLVNGEVNRVAGTVVQDNSLNQATIAYAWPFSERWSTLGVYSYNVSKKYDMLTFAGLQYDNCCWAFRIIGGRTFKSLNEDTYRPEYNSNIFFQVVLKGLGSATSGDPVSLIRNYLPGYVDIFRN